MIVHTRLTKGETDGHSKFDQLSSESLPTFANLIATR
jgi:hypothetical protein